MRPLTRVHEMVQAPNDEIDQHSASDQTDQKRKHALSGHVLLLETLLYVFCLFTHELVPVLRWRTRHTRAAGASNSDCGRSRPAKYRPWQRALPHPPTSGSMSLKNWA